MFLTDTLLRLLLFQFVLKLHPPVLLINNNNKKQYLFYFCVPQLLVSNKACILFIFRQGYQHMTISWLIVDFVIYILTNLNETVRSVTLIWGRIFIAVMWINKSSLQVEGHHKSEGSCSVWKPIIWCHVVSQCVTQCVTTAKYNTLQNSWMINLNQYTSDQLPSAMIFCITLFLDDFTEKEKQNESLLLQAVNDDYAFFSVARAFFRITSYHKFP